MGNPEQQRPEQHPGGQNYPAAPGAPQPTRPVERDESGATRGFDGAYPPVPAEPGQPGGPGYGVQNPPTQAYPGGYQLGYTQGPYGPQSGQQPPMGPPPGPGGPYGGGGDDGGSGGGNRKILWIAAAAVLVVLVLATVIVVFATGGSQQTSTATPATTTTTTTAPSSTRRGFSLPSGIPTSIPGDISIPPIFGGGSSTGANARQWQVEVTGSGSAQLVTVGVPDTNLFGSQPLPWSKAFTSDAFLVTVTVIGYTGDVSCKITRNGAVVAEESTKEGSSGPLICTAGR